MGVTKYLYIVVVLLFVEYEVEGLTCLRCERFSHPRFCKVATQCADGEVCYTEIEGNTDGSKSFTMGCTASTQVCNSTIDETSGQFCHQCCTTDLCNARLCGDHGYPKERGPICYNCHSNLLNEPCHIIGMCHLDEVCSISYERIFSDLVYTSGCSKLHECASHNHANPANIIGKRSIDEGSAYAEDDFDRGSCYQCCDVDLCNVNCSSITYKNHCEASPCKNGGTCVNNRSGYTCVCSPFYSGNNCEIDLHQCVSRPCMNGGTCTENFQGYNCSCAFGFTGSNCEIDINFCQPSPCLNGGTCIDTILGYTCKCIVGYTGNTCETDIDYCKARPCFNGGSCVERQQGYNCTCRVGFIGTRCQLDIRSVHSCQELQNSTGINTTGVYPIKGYTNTSVKVLCDMHTDGGGWTVFQNRFNGTVDFYQNFATYEHGFGNPHGEYWLGLMHMYELSRHCSNMEMRIDLEKSSGETDYRLFDHFRLSASPAYTLHVNNIKDPSDGLMLNDNRHFYTYDHEDGRGCPTKDRGGWWYNNCAYANLNGLYLTPGEISTGRSEAGMTYYNFDQRHSLKSSKMMLRCKS